MILFCVNQTCHALSLEMAQRLALQPHAERRGACRLEALVGRRIC